MTLLLRIILLLCFLCFFGCAGYAGSVEGMKTALYAGRKNEALEQINKSLDLKEADHYPIKADSKSSLLLMERATIKQALGKYEESTLDFRIAEGNMELLDVKRDPVGSMSQWIFSGSAGLYRAMPYEKLMLHVLNMINYLALEDLESARVEARKYMLVTTYLRDRGESDYYLGIGSYLAGFIFEKSGRYEQALQNYEMAIKAKNYPSLNTVIPQILACTDYRADYLREKYSSFVVEGCTLPSEKNTLLVISSLGLVPYKVPTRIPIGLALVIAGAYLSPSQTREANEFAVKGLLKWINFTSLEASKPAANRVTVSVDKSKIASEYAQNISSIVKKSFEETKGKMLAAAIVRMISRAVAGGATNRAVKGGGGDGLGLLAQVLVEGAMTVADTPDTRSWTTLPHSLVLSRADLEPGVRKVDVIFEGNAGTRVKNVSVNASKGGFSVVPIHMLR